MSRNKEKRTKTKRERIKAERLAQKEAEKKAREETKEILIRKGMRPNAFVNQPDYERTV